MTESRHLAVAHQKPGECAYCDDRYDRMRKEFELEFATLLEEQLHQGEWSGDELAPYGVRSVVEMIREVHGGK